MPRSQPSRPHDTPVVLRGDKHYAQMKARLRDDKQENEAEPKGLGKKRVGAHGHPTGGEVGGGPQRARGLGPFLLPGAASGNKET